MVDGPTTMNGPLHAREASLDNRKMTASFERRDQAKAAQDELIRAGMPPSSISIVEAAAAAVPLKPADPTLIGRLREAVLPDDGQTATRAAVRDGDYLLEVQPSEGMVESAIAIIQAHSPNHFDADLERWRNTPPA